jgi:multidrug resistance efflux pump
MLERGEPMSLAVSYETPLRVDDHSVVRMGDTRVSFDSIVYRHKQEEVEAYLAEREAEAERIHQEAEADPANKALREKLLARREQRG